MNVYLSKAFTRLAAREGLTNAHICQAVAEMNKGLIDVDLGSGLFKKRVAMPGLGKSRSWRILIGFQVERKAFFLYLFSKNSRANIEDDELRALKRLTKYYLTLKPDDIEAVLKCGELTEVKYVE